MEYAKLALIPILPLIGFLVNGCFGNRLGHRFVSLAGCLFPIASFVIAFQAFGQLRDLPGEEAALTYTLFEWIHFGSFQADMAFTFDGLSSVMCLVITGIGSLIHLYSTGYMRGDKSYARFFAYLNLFTAFMLVLVLGDNLLVLFVGWEGVGLCSYLLIGFWHQDSANCDAGRKAFIFNRVGDLGMLVGMFIIYFVVGSIEFSAISEFMKGLDPSAALSSLPGDRAFWGDVAIGTVFTVITLCLFLGATGKSAQIPLYPWLPDAMAGPTPVSALIHAATMVTSGVYLCCRMKDVFAFSPTTLGVIAAIGACTALLAALIALSQNDIKKVLAYSTVSQLGYMFFAVGVGAFSAALFHVVTHAFFKALLFLGSGSVIHAMDHEQDMRKMGGLRKQLPFTHTIFLIGTAAIAGVPLFAGFFSKDEILFSGFLQAFHSHGEHAPHFQDQLFWCMTVVTAGLTAFYMLRMVALTFWGPSRVADDVAEHVHEPTGWMPFSLAALAVLSIFGGLFNVPELLQGLPFIGEERALLLGSFTGLHDGHAGIEPDTLHSLEWTSMFISVGVGVLGLALAWYFYGPGRALLDGFVRGVGQPLVKVSENKFYVDELYQLIIVTPFQFLSFVMFILVDRFLIDGVLVGGSSLVVRSFGEFFRRMQSGFIPAYLLTFGCGALVLLFIMLSLLKGAG